MGGVINIITKAPTKREFSVKGGVWHEQFRRAARLVYQDRLGERVGIVLDYAHKQSDGYIKDEVVIKPSDCRRHDGHGCTADHRCQRQYRLPGRDKGTNGWNSQNLGVKLYVDLPADSRLTLGASQFLYESTGRNHYNTYLRDAAGNPVARGTLRWRARAQSRSSRKKIS